MSHVLIVDDEEAICWGLERLLREAGHRVSIASSAEDGLQAAGREPPDLIVLDVRLPGLDGLSAMPQFTAAAPAVPIIVITAFGSLDTAVRAVRNGAFDYLAKPFDLEQAGDARRAGPGFAPQAPPRRSHWTCRPNCSAAAPRCRKFSSTSPWWLPPTRPC